MKHESNEQIRYRAVRGMEGVEALEARRLRMTFDRHFHDTYAFGIVLAGVERCRIGAHLNFFEPGIVPLFNPGDVHDGGPAAPDGWSYRMVYLERRLVAGLLEDLGDDEPAFPAHSRSDEPARRRVRAVFDAIDCGSALGLQESLRLVLETLFDGRASERTAARVMPRLERVRERLEAECCGALRLRDLCAEAGLSPSALLRSFEGAFGLSPHRYQQSRRTTRARRLIAAGMPLAAVATECGYADQSHLNRWFLRVYGVTPGRFRTQLAESRARGAFEDHAISSKTGQRSSLRIAGDTR